MNMNYMILQLFAEAGSVVNTTTGTVNAHTGAATTTNARSPAITAISSQSAAPMR